MPVRAPFPVKDFSYEVIDYLERRLQFARHQPLWLGGAPGSPGSVVPPGGFIGLLPQNRVQYDPDQLEYASGGSTLMDNLAHDRNRLTEYIQQVAYPNSAGSSVSAGSLPSWGSGAWVVGFSPGSPPDVYTVQDAIQALYNQVHGGGTTFLELGDTPASYAGEAGLVVKVNEAENALEFGYALGAGNKITLHKGNGDPAIEYDADATGFDEASSAGSSGDTVWLPSMTIDGDHALTEGVHYIGVSRWGSILTGQITLADGATLERLTIERTADDYDVLKCVVNQASGTSKISECDIKGTQSGGSDVYAVSIENSGGVEIWNCYLYGYSSAGSGYAVHRTFGAGAAYLFGGRAYGSTDEFNE